MRVFTFVKQPQIRHRSPVWWAQDWQVDMRASWSWGAVFLSPEPMNFIIALVAETAIRSRPGPVFGSETGCAAVMTLAPIGPPVMIAPPEPGEPDPRPAKSTR